MLHTNRPHWKSGPTIDALPGPDALTMMLESQIAALNTLRPALDAIEQAAQHMARAFAAGATVHYAAAGSSGLMALADASELPGTFGVPQSQIRICMAGGVPTDAHMPGNTEDGADQATQNARTMAKGDLAIIVSASGTTPYALSFAKTAQDIGVPVIGIANVAGSALLAAADIAIALATAPEVVRGSTRLGAGTAQKVALNMISTRAGVVMGHVHDGLMVNLHPDNIKLRQRAVTIVRQIAGVSGDVAQRALDLTGYNTKCATLVALGVCVRDAETLLNQNRGHLHQCLKAVSDHTGPKS